MMRRMILSSIAAMLAAALAPAHAERADREKEIVVGADRATAADADNTITFEGGVVITQGTMRINANKVTMREDKDRHKYYVANGSPVTFRQKRDNADEWIEGFAERAEFDDRNDVLKLFNRARVKRNNDELAGDVITYDMKKELAEVTGAPAGTKSPNAGRVKVIILPPKRTDDKAPADKAAPPLTLRPDSGSQ
jgi:lipopolysaccharide export system protein LptA